MDDDESIEDTDDSTVGRVTAQFAAIEAAHSATGPGSAAWRLAEQARTATSPGSAALKAAQATRLTTGPGSAAFRAVDALDTQSTSLSAKLADIQKLADKGKFPGIKLPQIAVPPRPEFTAHLRQMEEQRLETERLLDIAIGAKERERAEKLERELQSLELARQMVESQQALIERQDVLVATQLEQAREGLITRRWEIAVFAVSALALVVGIVGIIVAIVIAPG